MKILSLKSNTIFTIFLIVFSLNVYSQSNADSPLLFQTWSFRKLRFLSSNFEKSKNLERKNLSFKLRKNGKITANWIEKGCFTGEKNFKFKRIKGDWKKISDSVININFSINVSLNGNHIISNLTENKLTLKMFVNLNKK